MSRGQQPDDPPRQPPADTVRFACPQCQRTLTGPTAAVGKTVVCKGCGAKFTAVPLATPQSKPQPPTPDPAPVAVYRPQSVAAPTPARDSAPVTDFRPPPAVVPDQPAGSPSPPAEPPVAPPIRISHEHRARGSFVTGFGCTLGAITAVVVSIVAVVILLVVLPAVYRVNEAMRRVKEAEQSQSVVATANDSGAPIAPAVAPPATGDKRAIAPGEAFSNDGVTVKAIRATVGIIPYKSRYQDGIFTGKKSELAVLVEVSHRTDTLKLDFSPWSRDDNLFGDRPICLDGFKNRYLHISTREYRPAETDGQDTVILAGQPVRDLVSFEPPIPKADYVDIDLPADAVGRKGAFRFRVPRVMWEPPADPPRPADKPVTPPPAPRRPTPPPSDPSVPDTPIDPVPMPDPPFVPRPGPTPWKDRPTVPPADLPPPAKPPGVRTLYPANGKLVLARSEGTLTDYEAISYDPAKQARMAAERQMLILTGPVDFEVVKLWEKEPTLRVIVLAGKRKGETLYCRRAHLDPPPAK